MLNLHNRQHCRCSQRCWRFLPGGSPQMEVSAKTPSLACTMNASQYSVIELPFQSERHQFIGCGGGHDFELPSRGNLAAKEPVFRS